MVELGGGFEAGVALCSLRALRRLVVVGVVVGLAVLMVPGFARAAVFNVMGTSDGTAACSGSSCPTLRSAVLAADNIGGSNTINVPAGHYALTLAPSGADDGTTGDLHLQSNVTIVGAGAGTGGTAITGSGDRIFDISAKSVTLSKMAIRGGSQEIDGGAIRDQADNASLTLTNDELSSNSTTSGGLGGALAMEPTGTGTLTITNSLFRSNTAAESGTGGGGFGGAVAFESETNGTMTVVNSEFDSNTAQSGTMGGGGFGGAIDFEPGDAATLTITGSTFSANVAAGSSVSQGGFGGAIMFQPSNAPSPLSITNSTFTGNQAGGLSSFGGAVMFEPGAGSSGTLTHVTIVGNSTSTANRGAGIYVEDSPLTVRNSIISGNLGAGASNNCTVASGGSLIRAGHNIELGTSCGFDINANPMVLALAKNGGQTDTMALAANSPARDAANPAFCPPTDQRGNPRPDDAGTPCDIGAYEFGTRVTLSPPHNTKIIRDKINNKKRTATFKFTATGTITGFQCGLVRVKKHHKTPKVKFTRCSSPKTYKHLRPGRYIFEVRAFNAAGPDPHAAIRRFSIKKRKH